MEAKALVPQIARLPGIDGKAKMSKSLGNALYLSDPIDVVQQKVKQMYTDPNHLKVSDPGNIEGNVVFSYLDAFDPDKAEVAALKEQYQRGGLGDMTIKKRLLEILEAFLKPIQERRTILAKDRSYVLTILKAGTERAKEITDQTLSEVKAAMHLHYFS